MLVALPILCCSLLAYPRLLLADYCSLSLLAADFSFLLVFTRYTLLIATHMRNRQKKMGRPTRQLKILKNSKTKKSTQCRQLQKKKRCPSIEKKIHLFMKKKRVGRLSANFKKSKKMVCEKKSWPKVGHSHLGDFRVCILIALIAARMQSSVEAISELCAACSSSCMSFFLLFFAARRFIHALSSSLLSFCCRQLVSKLPFFLFTVFSRPSLLVLSFFRCLIINSLNLLLSNICSLYIT